MDRMKHKVILLAIIGWLASSAVSAQLRSIENIGIGEISIIEVVQGGNLWVGSRTNGVGYYDATAQSWTYQNSGTNPRFLSDTVTSIVAVTITGIPRVYISTTNGIVTYKNNIWDNFKPTVDYKYTGLSLVSGDSIWISMADSGIALLDTSFHIVGTFTKSTSSIPYDLTSSLQRGGRQCVGICLAGPDSGVVYSGDGSSYVRYDTTLAHFGLVSNVVNTVWRDNNCANDRWIVGTRGGLSICPDSMPCVNFTTTTGLPENNITAVSQDCNGNFWLGMADSGIIVSNGTAFINRITTANGLSSNHVTAITFAQGSCTGYVATVDGNIAVLDTSGQVSQVLTGMSSIKGSDIKVTIYPQPATDRLYITGLPTLASLTIADVTGRIYSAPISGHMIDVSALPKGVYILRIQDNSGATVKRFVKD